MFALRWKLHWPITLLTLLMLPGLLGLGYWQMQRAEEKRNAQTAFAVAQDMAPLDIAQLPARPAQYTRVRMKGRYDNARSFLLDNRISHGRFGYEILSLFFPTGSATAVLVNRGWAEGDPARMQRPAIAPVEGEVELIGSVYRDTTRVHFVANAHEPHWPKLIQNLQLDDLQIQLGTAIFPFIVRLDAQMPGAYRAEWQVLDTFGPDRHVAYAVTWFSLAVVLAFIWVIANSNLAQLLKRNLHGD